MDIAKALSTCITSLRESQPTVQRSAEGCATCGHHHVTIRTVDEPVTIVLVFLEALLCIVESRTHPEWQFMIKQTIERAANVATDLRALAPVKDRLDRRDTLARLHFEIEHRQRQLAAEQGRSINSYRMSPPDDGAEFEGRETP